MPECLVVIGTKSCGTTVFDHAQIELEARDRLRQKSGVQMRRVYRHNDLFKFSKLEGIDRCQQCFKLSAVADMRRMPVAAPAAQRKPALPPARKGAAASGKARGSFGVTASSSIVSPDEADFARF